MRGRYNAQTLAEYKDIRIKHTCNNSFAMRSASLARASSESGTGSCCPCPCVAASPITSFFFAFFFSIVDVAAVDEGALCCHRSYDDFEIWSYNALKPKLQATQLTFLLVTLSSCLLLGTSSTTVFSSAWR